MQTAMETLRAVAFLLASAAAASAALSLGGAFSPRLDLFAEIAPLWMAAALTAIAVQAIAGFRWPATGLALAALLVGAALIGPDAIAGLSQRPVLLGSQTVRLIQFNLWDRNRAPGPTAQWILNQNADILVLEETGDGHVLEALEHAYPYRTPCPDDCATTILSRQSPYASGLIAWPGLDARHTGAWASFGHGAGAFTVAGIHYRWPVPALAQARQAAGFAAFLDRFDHNSLVVAGDFNLNPWTFALRRQDKRLGLSRLTHMLFTWPAGPLTHWRLPAPFALLAVDHVYAGHAWRPVAVFRGPVLGSDHFPVVAVLTR